jgi:hypothetical protein
MYYSDVFEHTSQELSTFNFDQRSEAVCDISTQGRNVMYHSMLTNALRQFVHTWPGFNV